jgi:DNA-binding NtrC family response regulator
MPGMSGLDLLPMVRARRPDLPIFMMLAYLDKKTNTTALGRGAKKFLTKPVDFAQLKLEVAAAIADARSPS